MLLELFSFSSAVNSGSTADTEFVDAEPFASSLSPIALVVPVVLLFCDHLSISRAPVPTAGEGLGGSGSGPLGESRVTADTPSEFFRENILATGCVGSACAASELLQVIDMREAIYVVERAKRIIFARMINEI